MAKQRRIYEMRDLRFLRLEEPGWYLHELTGYDHVAIRELGYESHMITTREGTIFGPFSHDDLQAIHKKINDRANQWNTYRSRGEEPPPIEKG